MLRTILVFLLLAIIKIASTILWRVRVQWVGVPLEKPWSRLRVTALLNHTSLFEPGFLGVPPPSFIWRLAAHGVVPAADKTTDRPLVGMVFRFIADEVIPITRQRDDTWAQVLSTIEPNSMVVLPEGRMKRANGLDLQGQPMTVRGGIADILQAISEGRMLLAYSGGLHHVQVPGQHLPRFFQKVGLLLEVVEIADYRAEMQSHGREFRIDVRDDLQERRDRYCPEAAELAGTEYLRPPGRAAEPSAASK